MPAPKGGQEDLQRAINDHLREQEKSLAHLLSQVAVLCEGEDSTSYFAHFLRNTGGRLQNTPCSYLPSVKPSSLPAPPGEERPGLSGLFLPGEERPAMPAQSIRIEALPAHQSIRLEALPEQQSMIDLQDLTPATEPMQGKMQEKDLIAIPSCPEKCSADDVDDGVIVPINIREDCGINRLPFMDSMGKMASIQSNAFLPTRIRHCKKCMAHLINWWEPMDNAFSRFVGGGCFKTITMMVIVLNFVFIVAQSNYKVTFLGEAEPDLFVVIGYCFTGFYVAELIMNMSANGKYFWRGADMYWNLFDFAIVLVSSIQLAHTLAGGKSMNASFLRVIRFIRISRVLRMFSAMRSFKEVKIMVDSLAGSLNIFAMCVGLLLLMLSLFSVFFVQGAATYLEANPDLDPVTKEELLDAYGSVATSVLTLYKSATGGTDWGTVYAITKTMGPQYDYLYLLFIGFYSFAFLNVISGVFCEKAMALAAPSTNDLIRNRYDKEFADAEELYHLLDRKLGDTSFSSSHAIDAKMFATFVADPQVEKYFQIRGATPSSVQRFFRMLCEMNNSDQVDVPTFVSGCVQLDGFASSMDMQVMFVRQLHGLHQLQQVQASQLEEVKISNQILQKKGTPRESPRQALLGHKQALMSAPDMVGAPMSSRTNWSDVEAKMQKHFVSLADEIKGQLQSVQEDLKTASQPQSPVANVMEMKANDPSISREGSNNVMDTPRTLTRNLEAESQKLRESQERFEALRLEAADGYKLADAAAAEIEIQRRSEEDLQHRLIQLERVHERTLKEVVAQTHKREAELKMQLNNQSVKLDQMHFQLRGNSRESNGNVPDSAGRESSRGSIFECTGSRDRCGPGRDDDRQMVGSPLSSFVDSSKRLPSFADSSRGYPTPSSNFNSQRGQC